MKLNRLEKTFIETKSPAEYLENQYKFSLKFMTIIMPIFIGLIILIGIVLSCVYANSVWWMGLIFIGVGLLMLTWFFIVRTIIKSKILAIQNYLANKKEQ